METKWSEEKINILLKGFLLCQELYKESSIDYFVKHYPEKYGFLTGANNNDEVICQGSLAEGTTVFGVREHNPDGMYGHLKYFRDFDCDVMHVKPYETINSDQLDKTFLTFVNETNLDLDADSRLQLWGEAKYCRHLDEPLVIFPARDESGRQATMTEHVGIFRPACRDCLNKDIFRDNGNNDEVILNVIDYHGRPLVPLKPHGLVYMMRDEIYFDPHRKNSALGNCEQTPIYMAPDGSVLLDNLTCDWPKDWSEVQVTHGDNNKEGDLCGMCQILTRTL